MEQRLHPKLKSFLDKSLANFNKGVKQALNFEINGKRFYGRDFESILIEDGTITFEANGEKITVSLKDIFRFRRLRARKYIFLVKEKASEKKGTPKPKKKVEPKKEAKKASEKVEKKDKKESDSE